MSNSENMTENLRCEICGNSNTQCFEVRLGGERHIFDSFECAMSAFSPRCGYCNCQILGHSIVLGKKIYCSYQCANDDHTREYEKRVWMSQQANP
jgi:hypothetical protein